MKSKKKGSREPSAKEITKAGPGIKPCSICKKARINPKDKSELDCAGKFYQLDKDHFFHYFCLLFSDGAKQLGNPEEGIHGFLKRDILQVLDNSKGKSCYLCDKKNATSKCYTCKKQFHYTCGFAKDATFIYDATLGNKSFCHEHSPKSRHKLKVMLPDGKPDRTCTAGCLQVVEPREKSFISPCCGRIYHTACVQGMANSYGSSHFKCPMCQDKEKFAKEAAFFGIYIPVKDADWEHPEQEDFYQYQQMGELHQTCDAQDCRCTKGRRFHLTGTRFEIIRCTNCGSKGVHIFCGNLNKRAPYYICDDHENSAKDMEAYDKKIKKTLKQEKLLDDEDSSTTTDDSYLIKPLPAASSSSSTASNLKRRRSNSSKASSCNKKPKQQRTTHRPAPQAIQRQEVMLQPGRKRSSSTSSNGSVEILPFKLQDPITKEVRVMPVGPLQYDFELNPSFELEGLALQASNVIRNRIEIAQEEAASTSGIIDQFSLKSLDQSTNDEEVIVLSDSD